MSKFRKLSHVYYKCEYHVVFTPKYRYRILTGPIKLVLEQDIRAISQWKDVEVEELNIMPDHVHMVCSIPPKISVSDYMGTIKGKIAIRMFKTYPNLKKKPYWGNHYWSKGYFISTIGLDSELIKRYVRFQENEDKREER